MTMRTDPCLHWWTHSQQNPAGKLGMQRVLIRCQRAYPRHRQGTYPGRTCEKVWSRWPEVNSHSKADELVIIQCRFGASSAPNLRKEMFKQCRTQGYNSEMRFTMHSEAAEDTAGQIIYEARFRAGPDNFHCRVTTSMPSDERLLSRSDGSQARAPGRESDPSAQLVGQAWSLAFV